MNEWQTVRIHAAGMQEHLGSEWKSDPAWDLTALYEHADEEVVSPDGTVRRFVFWNRHIDKRFHLEYPPTTRDNPRVHSRTIADPGREWDIVIAHRDRYLKEAGLTLDSPPEAIAKCLADTFKFNSYFKDKPMCPTFPDDPRSLCNPVEGLLFKSFCVGCAHAYAALADSCGLPARTIGCGAHRIAEVRVDGRWHMVENSCRHEDNEGLEAYFPASFMEVTADPAAYHPDYLPTKKINSYLKMPNGQFHFMGGHWQCPVTLRFSTSNAYALYPELERWGFKSLDGRRLPLVQRANGFYWEDIVHPSDAARWSAQRRKRCPFPVGDTDPAADFLYHPFRPGGKLRQSVWLGSLEGMTGLEVTIPVAPESHLDFGPVLGKALVVQVGDFEASLHDLDAWPGTEPDRRGHRHCTFVLPVDRLMPERVNWIILHNRGRDTLQTPFIPSAMEPYVEPLA